MHPDELANWKRIKESFEASGNTDNNYYQRACLIVAGKPDPLPLPDLTDPGDPT